MSDDVDIFNLYRKGSTWRVTFLRDEDPIIYKNDKLYYDFRLPNEEDLENKDIKKLSVEESDSFQGGSTNDEGCRDKKDTQ
jgi:hypothetical protein